MSVDLFGREVKGSPVIQKTEDGYRARSSRSRTNVKIRIEHGDCLDVLKRLADEGAQYDSCVTDPPYHLTSTVSRFRNTIVGGDSKVEQSAANRADSYGRLSKGFMGQQWDGGDVAFQPETWRAVYDVLKPGAFLLAFGGTRTHHRIWCAVEDAGFILQDTIMWIFGSGFPKRRDMLKPAYEPVCLAYKPGAARTMRIDECRDAPRATIGKASRRLAVSKSVGWKCPGQSSDVQLAKNQRALEVAHTIGRWPANVCHDGSDEVLAAFPDSDTARFFYSAKASSDERQGSKHPTVKPTNLMQWLVRLVTPFGGTVIDPFAGTGSTGAAAYLEGIDSVLIERDDNYIKDLRHKMAEFQNRRVRTLY